MAAATALLAYRVGALAARPVPVAKGKPLP